MTLTIRNKNKSTNESFVAITPKDTLIKFLREAVLYEPYSFQISGSQKFANDFIHRMRVELSRLRTKVRERGQVPKQFKILLERIDCNESMQDCIVTLIKTDGSRKKDLPPEIADILNDLSV